LIEWFLVQQAKYIYTKENKQVKKFILNISNLGILLYVESSGLQAQLQPAMLKRQNIIYFTPNLKFLIILQ
jgi:uncharacterized protein with PQ loop repeat